MPRVMLAKCAEAAAFRKAFPKRFGDIYTAEEMDQADTAAPPAQAAPTARERAAARVQQVTAAPETPAADPATGEVIEAEVREAPLGDHSTADTVTSETPGTEDAPTNASTNGQCPSMSGTDFGLSVQCRREVGHPGSHKTPDQSWPH